MKSPPTIEYYNLVAVHAVIKFATITKELGDASSVHAFF